MKVIITSKDVYVKFSHYDSLLDISTAIVDYGAVAARAAAPVITRKEDYICSSKCHRHFTCEKCKMQKRFDDIDKLLVIYGVRREEY